MKFLSLDLETTGLDPDYCQILEVGAIVGDLTDTPVEDLPQFHCFVYHERIIGEPFALAMNSALLRMMASGEGIGEHARGDYVWQALRRFLDQHFSPTTRITLAGKNVMSFDMRFLRRLPGFTPNVFHHRALDPGSMYWEPTDTEIPSTEECLHRAGLGISVTHRALDDARDAVRLIRAKHAVTTGAPTVAMTGRRGGIQIGPLPYDVGTRR